VVAAAPIGIMTYGADGDHHRRRCPRGVATADMMMTMAGKRKGKVTARQWWGNYKATTRQQRATRMQRHQLWRCRWQGQRGNLFNNKSDLCTHLESRRVMLYE
jgi:hypothetical protein